MTNKQSAKQSQKDIDEENFVSEEKMEKFLNSKTILEEFDEKWPQIENPDTINEHLNAERKEIKDFIIKALEDKKRDITFEILEDYTNWLVKHNYCDSDVYTEEPKAIEEYWKEKYY